VTVAEKTVQPRLSTTEPARRKAAARDTEISLIAVFTASVWLACLAIGIIGVVIPYARPQFSKPQPPPIQAELLDIALTTDPVADPDISPPPPATTPPPLVQPIAPPSAPALIPVAAPNPTIAFELPVAGPTRIVEASQASYSTPDTTANITASQPTVAQLTFGRGEGKQPAPAYPPRALSEGQEGTVQIEFTVGADGRTLAAELKSKSPWPLLNEAALKVVRERWRFAPGAVRRYEVPIHFRIRK
jgi:periplasmic protein TonB